MRRPGFALLFALLLAVPGGTVFAHLAGGEDKVSGRYLVDFGWEPEQLTAGEPATLAFNLVDGKSGGMLDFDSVWVRIAKGDDIEFAGSFRPQAMNVTFASVFSSSGEHQVTARFKGAEGDVITETAFTVPVKEPVSASSSDALMIAIAAAVLGFAAGRMMRHRA